MSEPMYMQGDSIARSLSELSTHEYTCECGVEATVEVEEQVHGPSGTFTYFGTYRCPACHKDNEVEGWDWL